MIMPGTLERILHKNNKCNNKIKKEKTIEKFGEKFTQKIHGMVMTGLW